MDNTRPALILIRGGGDLASGVALRLHRAGLKVLISELAQPLAVRRSVCLCEAIYKKQVIVEGVTAILVNEKQVWTTLDANEIPVLVDPEASILNQYPISIVIDARLTKMPPSPLPVDVPLHIGLGPGFYAGRNCDVVIETRRSHTLGRAYWDGTSQPDSGQPDGDPRRVLRAPIDGQFVGYAQIGDHVDMGQLIAGVIPQDLMSEAKLTGSREDTIVPSFLQDDIIKIRSPFKGVLRGLIHPGLHVTNGLKVGDVDPRDDPTICNLVSDKALAIGGGVLEAIFSKNKLRENLWER